LAATSLVITHLVWSLVAFAALLTGLLALSVYPLIGVLLTLGGMALLLHGASGLCGVQQRRRQ